MFSLHVYTKVLKNSWKKNFLSIFEIKKIMCNFVSEFFGKIKPNCVEKNEVSFRKFFKIFFQKIIKLSTLLDLKLLFLVAKKFIK